MWNGILSGVEVHSDLLNFFLSRTEIKLGDGKQVFFWLDKWLRNMKLKDEFPRLFSLSIEKEDSLEFFVQRKKGVGGWHLTFRRPLRSWEEAGVVRLYALLAEAPPLRPNIPDSLRWLRSSSGKFTVAAVREWLAARHGPKLMIPTLLWGNVAPPKVQFLGWLIWKRRVKTIDFLLRIGVLSSSVSNVCPFCKAEPESLNHIFLLCRGIWESWNELLNWWDVTWVSPAAVVDLLHW